MPASMEKGGSTAMSSGTFIFLPRNTLVSDPGWNVLGVFLGERSQLLPLLSESVEVFKKDFTESTINHFLNLILTHSSHHIC